MNMKQLSVESSDNSHCLSSSPLCLSIFLLFQNLSYFFQACPKEVQDLSLYCFDQCLPAGKHAEMF